MNTAEPKPAASLAPTLIRRGQGRAVPAAAAPPASTAEMTGGLAIPPAPGVGGIAAPTAKRSRRRMMSWRSAGLFGALYLAALVLFAAAFDMWPS